MDVLAGVHDIPWAALDHCFGASDDIPDLLRQTAAGSAESLEELGGYMVHQGTLYEATPYLVRFLARIAASGVATAGILDLLGIAASCDNADQDPDVRGKTRAALAGEITALIPLLADRSDEVRDAAAWALPQSLAADRLVPPLRVRWDRELSPPIAASVLRGLSLVDPAGTVTPGAEALAGKDSAIRTPFLAGLMGSWGPAAAAAIPDLLEILPRHGYSVGCALADIAGATPEAVSLLRQAAAGSAGLNAAARLRALTGDEDPLLAAIESALTHAGYGLRHAAEAARTLTPATRLIPALAAALDATASHARQDDETRIELALALWHHSGDPAPAVEVIAVKLRADATPPRFGPGAAGAAQAAAVIGPAARPLIPAILPLLDSPEACPAAAQALLRIDPETHGGIPLATLAERLLLPLGRTWSSTQMSAVQMLAEIGLPQLPAHAVARLRELATQDRRIVSSGHVQALIHDDDQIRAAIRDLIDDTGQPAPPGTRR